MSAIRGVLNLADSPALQISRGLTSLLGLFKRLFPRGLVEHSSFGVNKGRTASWLN